MCNVTNFLFFFKLEKELLSFLFFQLFFILFEFQLIWKVYQLLIFFLSSPQSLKSLSIILFAALRFRVSILSSLLHISSYPSPLLCTSGLYTVPLKNPTRVSHFEESNRLSNQFHSNNLTITEFNSGNNSKPPTSRFQ